jgi:hypothetical protein
LAFTRAEEPCLVSVKVPIVSVLGSIPTEKVAVTLAVAATPLVLLAGLVLLTVGAGLPTVTVTESEAEEVLPAASVALAV